MVEPSHQGDRREPRYGSSQSAVLTTGRGVNRLCVIRNVSKGGAYLAVVGSGHPSVNGRIGLATRNRTYLSTIIGKDSRGVHCKFDSPLGESDLWQLTPERAAIDAAEGYSRLEKSDDATPPIFPLNDQNTANGEGPALTQDSIDLSYLYRTYSEGWAACREQVDSSKGDATMVASNPYSAQPEHERWSAGFADCLALAHRQAAKVVKGGR